MNKQLQSLLDEMRGRREIYNSFDVLKEAKHAGYQYQF